jgi:hypothetical protein
MISKGLYASIVELVIPYEEYKQLPCPLTLNSIDVGIRRLINKHISITLINIMCKGDVTIKTWVYTDNTYNYVIKTIGENIDRYCYC